MLKKELVFAALAASLLAAGTASATAAASCMDTCREYIGNKIIFDGNAYQLGNCTESADDSGSVTTCNYYPA